MYERVYGMVWLHLNMMALLPCAGGVCITLSTNFGSILILQFGFAVVGSIRFLINRNWNRVGTLN